MEKTIKLSQVEKQAKLIAKTLNGGEVLALSGSLGSGKTTFTKAVAKAMKVKQTVTSPTFVLMQEYKTGKTKNKSKAPLWIYHLDLYRTKNFAEVSGLGIEEVWGRPEVITIIEWADKISGHLPKKTIHINFIRDINAD
jgi:tRNA threonylcarbamoyladenosine biosynthesis protein TsaE